MRFGRSLVSAFCAGIDNIGQNRVMRSLFLAAILCGAFSSNASTGIGKRDLDISCQEELEGSTISGVTNHSEIAVRQLALLRSVESDINDWLPENLRIPEVEITLSPSSAGSFAVYAQLPRQLIDMGTKDFQNGGDAEMSAIFVHEYGHFIFAKYFQMPVILETDYENRSKLQEILDSEILNSDPEYKNLLSKVEGLREEMNAARAISNSMERDRVIANLYRRIKAWELKLFTCPAYSLFSLRQSQYLTKHKAISGYNELFADTVAFLFTGKPDVMADSIGIPQVAPFVRMNDGFNFRGTNQPSIRPRDFTATVSFRDWMWDTRDNYFMYSQFDPVRGAFFKLIQNRAVPRSRYPEVVSVLLRSIAEHLKLYEIKTYDKLFQLDIGKMNQEFFAILVKQLKLQGLI